MKNIVKQLNQLSGISFPSAVSVGKEKKQFIANPVDLASYSKSVEEILKVFKSVSIMELETYERGLKEMLKDIQTTDDPKMAVINIPDNLTGCEFITVESPAPEPEAGKERETGEGEPEKKPIHQSVIEKKFGVVNNIVASDPSKPLSDLLVSDILSENLPEAKDVAADFSHAPIFASAKDNCIIGILEGSLSMPVDDENEQMNFLLTYGPEYSLIRIYGSNSSPDDLDSIKANKEAFSEKFIKQGSSDLVSLDSRQPVSQLPSFLLKQ